MEPDDYCDIFCSHFVDDQPPRLFDFIGDLDEFVDLDNGDGLAFGRVERYRCPLTNTTTIFLYFDYIPRAVNVRSVYVEVKFRIAITVHHVDDSEIDDSCL